MLNMKDTVVRVFLVLALGWILGYFHHFFATRAEVYAAAERTAALTERVRDLEAKVTEVQKVMVKTTAYSNDSYSINVLKWLDGYTATGTNPKRGIVAADWRVFPPGTQLYIPGYGEAVVEDSGGAVKGYHLDLYVDSNDEARRWGVKDMDVYVLKKGNRSS